MKILIIEDEEPAAKRLIRLIEKYLPGSIILAVIPSVSEGLAWLKANKNAELIFADVKLSDGVSMDIFKKLKLSVPVIFTTAYDKFLLESFEYNSIDYLLKPITEDRFQKTISKLSQLEEHFRHLSDSENKSTYINRIIVTKGIEKLALEVNSVAYFFSEYKIVFAVDFLNGRYITDTTLTELEEKLNPYNFFRINRKYIGNRNSILKFVSQPKGKIQVFTKPEVGEEVIVSQENASAFKRWVSNSAG